MMVIEKLIVFTFFFIAIQLSNGEQSTTELDKPFIESDSTVNAILGKRVSLKCLVHNLKNYKIAWYFNGMLLTLNTIRIKSDQRYSVENPSANLWILNIEPVDLSNDGEYSCQLTNGIKNNVYLRVGVAPSFVENNGSHQVVVNMLENQNVTLSCEATGNPKPDIFWYKNGEPIGTGPTLFLKQVNRLSHLEYECVARNAIEPDSSRNFKLDVNFKPEINLMYHLKNVQSHGKRPFNNPNSNKNGVLSGDLQLVCEVVGNPINSIYWFKDGLSLSQNPKHKRFHNNKLNLNGKQKEKRVTIHTTNISPNKFISKLRIENFDTSDNGIYECCVNGIEGESSRSIIIDEIRNSTNSKEDYSNHNRIYSASGRESNEWILKNQKGSGRSFTDTVSFSYRQESKEREARSNSTQLFDSFENNVPNHFQPSIIWICALGVVIYLFTSCFHATY